MMVRTITSCDLPQPLPVNITNLEQVTFGVTEFEASSRFWTDFGLKPAAVEDPSARRFTAQDGSCVELRKLDDPSLPATYEAGATLREATFGVRSDQDLAALARELGRDREIRADGDRDAAAAPPGAFGPLDPRGAYPSTRGRPRAQR
jgi:catechol 2,3-dioxygenase-like lactoylglutathione lyase family enzyme